MIFPILAIICISALITFLFTIPTIVLAKKWKLVDNPQERPHPAHTHIGIIPRAGGIPLFIGIFLPFFLFFPFNTQLIVIFFAALALVLTGIWDDKKDRSPYIRLFINFVIALFVIQAGITIPFITNPMGGILHLDKIIFLTIPLSSIVALIWIVWTTNIVGWSGGVDGQLPGFVSICALVIGLLALRSIPTDLSQLTVVYLSFLTAGAYLGFLPFNFYPQKIMPGYGGKTLAGFLLAILSLLSSSKLGTALLVLSVPMIDAVWIMVRRLFSGRSPVFASNQHLHHLLLSLNWDKRKIAFFYWFISALAGVAALTLNSKQKIFVGICIVVIITGFIFLISSFRNINNKS
jgi:UDP-GlcNAc:undecaprenyl-phosphate/decaprenyl-phosphate GlcNAc-1-phosphate transferase